MVSHVYILIKADNPGIVAEANGLGFYSTISTNGQLCICHREEGALPPTAEEMPLAYANPASVPAYYDSTEISDVFDITHAQAYVMVRYPATGIGLSDGWGVPRP